MPSCSGPSPEWPLGCRDASRGEAVNSLAGGADVQPGTVVVDADGRVVAADHAFCAIVARPLDQVVGAEPPYPWWPDDQVPWFLAQFGPRLQSAPRRRAFEGVYQRADGGRVPIAGEATAVTGTEGDVFLVLRTVALAVAAPGGSREPLPERPPAHLSVALGRLFESNIVGIIAGRGDEVLQANDAFLGMLGYTRAEFDAGGINWAHLTPPEWHDADARAGELMLQRGASPPIEKEYVRKDGSRVRVRITGAVITEQPFRWVSVVQDRTAEREYIEAIRRAVVPPALPQPAGIVVDARFFASDGFTGDFYDLFPLVGDAGWGLVVGDVAGHGHPAAAMTALTRHALHGAALADPRPANALALLNKAMRDANLEPSYCTAVFAQLCVGDDTLRGRLARAGHPYPLVVRRDGRVEQLRPRGVPLGVLAAPVLEEEDVTLDTGDVLVLYTDGLIEARRSDQRLSIEALAHVAGTAAGTSPHAVADAILDHIHDRLSRPLEDDIALITLAARD